MSGYRLFHSFGEVVPQVPAVGHLDGVGGTRSYAVGVGAGAVTAHDFGAGMLLQPGSDGLRGPIAEQIDRCAGGDIDTTVP